MGSVGHSITSRSNNARRDCNSSENFHLHTRVCGFVWRDAVHCALFTLRYQEHVHGLKKFHRLLCAMDFGMLWSRRHGCAGDCLSCDGYDCVVCKLMNFAL